MNILLAIGLILLTAFCMYIMHKISKRVWGGYDGFDIFLIWILIPLYTVYCIFRVSTTGHLWGYIFPYVVFTIIAISNMDFKKK